MFSLYTNPMLDTARKSSTTVTVRRNTRSWPDRAGPEERQGPEHEGGIGADDHPPTLQAVSAADDHGVDDGG